MDWTRSIDFYCERLSSEFWSEPINAVSNLAFLLAGVYGLNQWRQKRSGWVLALSLLAFSVGIGSFLFHTYAQAWSHLADILPIGIFMATFIAYCLRHIFYFSKATSTVLLITFIVLCVLVERYQPRHLLNGSLGYSHALVTLFVVTISLWRKQHQQTRNFAILCLVFVLNLTFRTLDHAVCLHFPVGTHFLWHVGNGYLMYLILKILIGNLNRQNTLVVQS